MKFVALSLAPLCLLTAACGGGGGGGGGGPISTPTPPPAPTPTPTPTPANVTMGSLVASQTFAGNAGANEVEFDLTAGTTTSTSQAPSALTIRYDAPSNSYNVTQAGETDTFAGADIVSNDALDTRYRKTDAGGTTYLTIVNTPYYSSTPNQYVRMAYLQRNAVTGNQQDTFFSTFTYGLDTLPGGMPRTGSATFAIDVFGLATKVGEQPRVFQGEGNFYTDFAQGEFTAHSWLEEWNLLTGAGIFGGGVALTAGGQLSATNGTFSGLVLYEGAFGKSGGTLNGAFYGPAAQELGASFSGTGYGGTFTGSFTGTRGGTGTIPNFALTNLTQPQSFFLKSSELRIMQSSGSSNISVSRYIGAAGSFHHRGAHDFTVAMGSSDLPPVPVTASDQISSGDPNFTAYRTSIEGGDVTLKVSRPGSANTLVPLTYTSFGSYERTWTAGVNTYDDEVYFVYGLPTPGGTHMGRTGTAQYRGIAVGSGANPNTGDRYDVSGTSAIDIDFNSQMLTGSLALLGTGRDGSANVDFGNFDFSGALGTTGFLAYELYAGGIDPTGQLEARFYGPTGEEIAGPFGITVVGGSPGDGTAIAGIFAASEQ